MGLENDQQLNRSGYGQAFQSMLAITKNAMCNQLNFQNDKFHLRAIAPFLKNFLGESLPKK